VSLHARFSSCAPLFHLRIETKYLYFQYVLNEWGFSSSSLSNFAWLPFRQRAATCGNFHSVTLFSFSRLHVQKSYIYLLKSTWKRSTTKVHSQCWNSIRYWLLQRLLPYNINNIPITKEQSPTPGRYFLSGLLFISHTYLTGCGDQRHLQNKILETSLFNRLFSGEKGKIFGGTRAAIVQTTEVKV
jgi:hypothetical protein